MSTGNSTATAVASTVTTVADANLDLSATLRWANAIDVVTMDPHKVSAASAAQFLFPAYDALTFLDVSGKPQPMLATSWDVSENPPSLTFHLRQGVKFESGTPFDATAVKANIERALDKNVSLVFGDLAGVTSVEVVDASTVRLNSSEPLPELPIVLADRAGMMIDPTMFDSPDLASKGAGIGPYKLANHVPGSEIDFERTDGYWDPSAQKVAAIKILVIKDEAARINAVISGQADFLELAPGQFDQARSAGLNIVSGPVLQVDRIAFNTAKSEFGKQEVRQALNSAIDREGIVSTILKDTCRVQNQFFPPDYIAHSDSVAADLYKYDPAKAKELLASVGLQNGFSFEALVVNSSNYLAYAQVLQQNFKDIGVNMTITPVDGADIVNAFYKDKKGDAYIGGGIASAAPSTWAQLSYTREGFRNPGGATTDEMEQLSNDVRHIVDPVKLKAAWDKLSADAAEYAFAGEICGRTLGDAASPRVVGLQIYLASQRQIRGVGLKAKG